MDQGVIANFKVYYRTLVVQKLLVAFDSRDENTEFATENFKFSVLDALHTVRTAWGFVTEETIANCYRHAGFRDPATASPP